MDTVAPRPLSYALDAAPTFTSELDPGALIDADLFAAFAAGELPAARMVHLPRARADGDRALPGGRVARTVAWNDSRWTLVDGPDWRVRVRADDDGETFVWVFGADDAVVARIAAIVERWRAPKTLAPDSVELTFCYLGERHVARRRRRIAAPHWSAVAHNYTGTVRAAVDRMVALTPDRLTGRLALLWGPPGTGKTSLLRTLARHWAPWCDTVYVSDPERLFNTPNYLNSLLVDGDDEPGERWSLLVLRTVTSSCGPTPRTRAAKRCRAC